MCNQIRVNELEQEIYLTATVTQYDLSAKFLSTLVTRISLHSNLYNDLKWIQKNLSDKSQRDKTRSHAKITLTLVESNKLLRCRFVCLDQSRSHPNARWAQRFLSSVTVMPRKSKKWVNIIAKSKDKVSYCLTKISIRAKRSISRVFSLFIVPSPFCVHCPHKSRINRAESVLTGQKPY